MLRYLSKIKQYLLGEKTRPSASSSSPAPLVKTQVSCRTAFHGSEYGGWMLCPDGLSPNSVVYSFGVGEDASFDLSVINEYGSQVYAFDPTPRSIQWVRGQIWPPQFHFTPIGIAAQDGIVEFRPPENPEFVSHTMLARPTTENRSIQVQVKRLVTLARKLGHQKIDVLKMDIEGAEYEVIPDIVKLLPEVEIKQILVEFHHFFPNVRDEKTIAAIERLNSVGYRVYHISSSGNEYSFIRQ